jgi:5-(carboxyamino)imidazole ribonucleotide synthase
MALHLEPVLPGSFLGILGGGQLGRMFTQAAQAMGYKVCVLDPDADSPAGSIAEKFINADYEDVKALKEMASLCASVSTEFENVPAQALDQLESLGAFVAPRSGCVSLAQNRLAIQMQFSIRVS